MSEVNAMTLLANHGIFWYIGVAGILLEIVGAWYMVQATFRARQRIQGMFQAWDGFKEMLLIKEVLQSQARTETIGFEGVS
jgi:hypothetical protein